MEVPNMTIVCWVVLMTFLAHQRMLLNVLRKEKIRT